MRELLLMRGNSDFLAEMSLVVASRCRFNRRSKLSPMTPMRVPMPCRHSLATFSYDDALTTKL